MNRSSGQAWTLPPEQTVGRADGCLQLSSGVVSIRHADIRWTERGWQVKDLASTNGTFVNNAKLAPQTWHLLARGDAVAFGDVESEVWELENAAPPWPLVEPLDGSPRLTVAGMLGVPPEAPEATIWQDQSGAWWLEPIDKPAELLEPGQTFRVGERAFRFVSHPPLSTTQIVHTGLDTRSMSLHIRHSLDEEYVEALVKNYEGTISLGGREHHYTLLTLARERLGDRGRGLPEGSCGWMPVELLMQRLKRERVDLNLQVFRIRKQFHDAGIRDANVIERRIATRQLRVGFERIEISTL